jgi:glutaconyl-CoA/methylmalonyl-CoA decarboxylase subunit gamma
MKLGFTKTTNDKKNPVYITMSNTGKKFEFKFREDGVLKVNGKNAEIKIIENEAGFTYIVFKKHKYPVEIIERHQNKYHILINGVSYYFSVETPFSYLRKMHLSKIQGESKTELILAPMPGKIVDVLVEENTMVKEGDSLVILEAMKMQNEILSHAAGKVKYIKIKAEDTVMKDEILVEIEK